MLIALLLYNYVHSSLDLRSTLCDLRDRGITELPSCIHIHIHVFVQFFADVP